MKRPEISEGALLDFFETAFPEGEAKKTSLAELDFWAAIDWIADNVEPHHLYPENYLKEYCIQYLGHDRG